MNRRHRSNRSHPEHPLGDRDVQRRLQKRILPVLCDLAAVWCEVVLSSCQNEASVSLSL